MGVATGGPSRTSCAWPPVVTLREWGAQRPAQNLDDQAASRSSAYKKPPPLEIHIYIQIEPGSQATKRMLSESDGLRVPKRRTQSEQDSPRIRGVQLTEAGRGVKSP